MLEEAPVKLILLHPNDNVAVLPKRVQAGNPVTHGQRIFITALELVTGSKIAIRRIPRGAEVRKYGFPIGLATEEISPGEWVHLHNMRSNYIPTHTIKRIPSLR